MLKKKRLILIAAGFAALVLSLSFSQHFASAIDFRTLKAVNPCAAKAMNPCVVKVLNPCAANPCARR